MPSITVGASFESAVASGAKKAHIIRRRKREQDRIAAMSNLTIYASRARKIVRIIDTVCTSTRPIFRVRPGYWAFNDAPRALDLSKRDLEQLAVELGFPAAKDLDAHFTREFRTETITGLVLVRWR